MVTKEELQERFPAFLGIKMEGTEKKLKLLLENILPYPEVGETLTVKVLTDLQKAKTGKGPAPLMATPIIPDANKTRYKDDYNLEEGLEYKFFIPVVGRSFLSKYLKEVSQNLIDCQITIEVKEWKTDRQDVDRDKSGKAKSIVIIRAEKTPDDLTKMEILEGNHMNTKLVGEPAFTHLMRIHPEKFEKIENMNIKDLKSKKIFKITHSFVFAGTNEVTILPIHHLNYGNDNLFPSGGIIFPIEEKDSDEYDKVWQRISDIIANVPEDDEKLLSIVGTVWEERRDRFFPIVLDEDNNLMVNVIIEDPKTKDLMNYKLKQIDSLKVEALKMKMPEKVADLENGMSSYKFLGNIDRKIAFDIPAERQDYTCFGCGYRPKNVNKHFDTYDIEEGRKLEPHRIVHNCFLGDYDRNNVVILCEKCHNLEYKYFKVHWNRFFENGKLMEWNKLIEESFEFFKEYLVWLHLRK